MDFTEPRDGHAVGDYILGLDLGPSSIGWAVIECNKGTPFRLVRAGVRRFEAGVQGDIEKGGDESRATQRRAARGPRRQHWRRQWRLKKLFQLLSNSGLLPACDSSDADVRHQTLLDLDAKLREELAPTQSRAEAHVFPYTLRAMAIQQPLPLLAVGRALYHLAQRRGFLSNRKAAKKTEDTGVVKAGISRLHDEMQRVGAPTLGAYFATLDPEEHRIRARWTSRQMYLDEFKRIWSFQSAHHPELTDELKKLVHAAIFYQRPLKSQKGLIGRCELEPGKRRAPLACLLAQRFRIVQRVNDLRVTAPNGEVRQLTPPERQILIEELSKKAKLTWADVRKLLKMKRSKEFGRNWEFNLEAAGEKELIGNRTAAKLSETLGDAWLRLSSTQQEQLVDEILSFESEDTLEKRLINAWNVPPADAVAASQLVLEQGYASLSRKAMAVLLPDMEQGDSYSTARIKHYGDSLRTERVYEKLPPVRPTNPDRQGAFPELRNPAVERAMSELRKVVNAVIRWCRKKPHLIRIELARDLKHSRKRRKQMVTLRNRNTKARDDAKKRILQEMGERYVTPENILKVRLAEECGWICPFTGKPIGMEALVGDHPQFDIEHIIPFSRCLDNSFTNKTLCYHEENRNRKRNRTPWEAYHGTPQYDEIIQRVRRFNSEMRAKKLALFQMEKLPSENEFAEKLLSDTRYICRLASQYLGLLYGSKLKVDDQSKLRVQVSAGRTTAYLRQRWNLNSILGHDDDKNRADHRHHAIDAIVIALTDPGTVRLLARAAQEAEHRGDSKLFADVDPPWDGFLKDVREVIGKINVSSRVSRRLNGSLHEDTILSKPRMATNNKGQLVEVHHVRKRLEAMSAQEVDAIVDPRVRQLVKERLQALGGKPAEAFKDPNQHPCLIAKGRRVIPIHKARIRKAGRPVPIGQGSKQRYVAPGENHHMEIVAVLDKDGNEIRWEGVIVSRLEAVQRHRRNAPIIQRDHGEGKRFKFSLAGGEHVIMTVDGRKDVLLRLTSISEGELEFVEHWDARSTKLRKKEGGRIRRSPDSLRKLNAQKVVVSPLGDIFEAND